MKTFFLSAAADQYTGWLRGLSQTVSGGHPILAQWVFHILVTLCIALSMSIVYRFVSRAIHRSENLGKSEVNQKFLLKLSRTLCTLFAVLLILMQFEQLRTLAVSLLTGTGVITLCIGLASQEVMANLVSGMFLMINRPFVVGDRISIPEKSITGVVENITLRHTVVRTIDNTAVIIPNSMANSVIIENITEANRARGVLEIGVAYDADLTLAREIMARHIAAHPSFLDTRTPEQIEANEPPIIVRLTTLGDSAVTLTGIFWAADPATRYAMLSDLRLSIKAEFEEKGIEIPFPQQVVHLKKD